MFETKLGLPQELRVSNAALFAQIMPNEDLLPTISSADVMYVSNTFHCRNNDLFDASASSALVVNARSPQQETIATGMMECMKQCMQMMMRHETTHTLSQGQSNQGIPAKVHNLELVSCVGGFGVAE